MDIHNKLASWHWKQCRTYNSELRNCYEVDMKRICLGLLIASVSIATFGQPPSSSAGSEALPFALTLSFIHGFHGLEDTPSGQSRWIRRGLHSGSGRPTPLATQLQRSDQKKAHLAVFLTFVTAKAIPFLHAHGIRPTRG